MLRCSPSLAHKRAGWGLHEQVVGAAVCTGYTWYTNINTTWVHMQLNCLCIQYSSTEPYDSSIALNAFLALRTTPHNLHVSSFDGIIEHTADVSFLIMVWMYR